MRLKFQITLISLLVLCSTNYSQGSRVIENKKDTIDYLISAIKQHQTLGVRAIGPYASNQYCRFLMLIPLLTNKDFVTLIKQNAGCIRIYAYIGLVHKHYSKRKRIKKILLLDTTLVYTHSGDAFGQSSRLNIIVQNIKKWYLRKYTNQMLQLFAEDPLYRKDIIDNAFSEY